MRESQSTEMASRVVILCSATLAVACTALGGQARPSTLSTLAVEPAILEVRPGEGVESSECEWFAALVSDQATASARRAVLELGLARVVLTGLEAHGESSHLTTYLSMPVDPPAGIAGSAAAFIDGSLATARVELVDSAGNIIATGESAIGWDEVRWTTGGPKIRRRRSPDLALLDAATSAVRDAALDLSAKLGQRPQPKDG